MAHNNTPAVNGETNVFRPVSSTGKRSYALSEPRPASHGRGQGLVPSESPSWQTEASHDPIDLPVDGLADPWLGNSYNCWPLAEHYAEVYVILLQYASVTVTRILLYNEIHVCGGLEIVVGSYST